MNQLVGDVTAGPGTGTQTATVVGLQGSPISSTSPSDAGYPFNGSNTQATLVWNGSEYVPTQPVSITYIGKNLPGTGFGSCVDDTPYLQAIVNAYGVGPTAPYGSYGIVINLVNTVFQTAVDFSPFYFASIPITINMYGTHRYLLNKAELILYGQQSLNGMGNIGTGDAASGALAQIYSLNSAGQLATREPNSATSDGYVDADYWYGYDLSLAIGDPVFTGAVLGQTLEVTAATGDPAFVSSNWLVIGDKTVNPEYGYLHVVWTGAPGTAPTGSASSVSWSIPGLARSGTGASVGAFGSTPMIRVWSVAPIDNTSRNCVRYWMQLSNANSDLLNNGFFRIFGFDPNTNSAFLVAASLVANGFAGPDYGIGGAAGGPYNINTYSSTAAISLFGNNSANNLFMGVGGPGIIMDPGIGDQHGSINSCVIYASVCIIIDTWFYFYINGCQLYGGFPGAILMTTTLNNNTYTGIGKITNTTSFGYAVFVQEEMCPVQGAEFDQYVAEEIPLVPGQSFAALVVVGRLGCGGGWYFHQTGSADSSPPLYLIEFMYPVYNPNVYGGSTFVPLIHVDTCYGVSSPLGPQLSITSDVIYDNSGFTQEPVPPWNMTAVSCGLTDTGLVGGGDDFSPVLTLPCLPLPPLATADDWNALTGAAVAYGTDANGYQIIGPDGRAGNYIRLAGPGAYKVIRNYDTSDLPNLQVGDAFLCFMRVKGTNVNDFCSDGIMFQVAGSEARVNNNEGNWDFLSANINDEYSANKFGAQWLDVCGVGTIIGGTPTDVALVLYPTETGTSDLIIDPESIAIVYCPISQTLNDGFNTGPSTSIAEYVRLYRKLRRQILGATVGDVAIPSRNGISLGPSSFAGSRLQTVNLSTTSTGPEPAFTYTVPAGQAFNLDVKWVALVPSGVATGNISGGAFNVVGYNNAGTVTCSSVNTHGTDYNTGSSGAAASPPFAVATGVGTVTLNVNAESLSQTDWQLTVIQTNVC